MEIRSGDAAFITGGASGIGLGVARALCAEGARVILADVDESALRVAADQLTDEGANVLPIVLDVRDPLSWAAAADQAWTWSGDVAMLCNCAGVVFLGAATEQPLDVWRLTYEVNVLGPYLGVRAFLPRMLASGRDGRIVNVASLAGLWGESKLAAYTASKFALVGLSEALQLELARTRVGVTLVFPGPTRTNLGRSTQKFGEQAGVLSASPPRRNAEPRGMDPDAVGRRIVEGIRADAFYVVTHPDWLPMLEARHQALRAAFGEPAEPDYGDSREVVDKLTARLGAALGTPSAP